MRSRLIVGLGMLAAVAGFAGCSAPDVAGPLGPEVVLNGGEDPCPTSGDVVIASGDVCSPCPTTFAILEEGGTTDPCPVINGRMTGGGGQIVVGVARVTRGFTIHCDITLSNNVEVNWEGNHWHLDKPLTGAVCVDDPAISPEPPDAPFDTFSGEGVGKLNGVDGSTIRFVFADAGEPGGRNDRAQIQIFAPDGTLVLDVPMSFLDRGNLQAHYDQPHS